MTVVEAYLERIGLDPPSGGPGLDALRLLHRTHLERVPFENLDIELGRPIRLGDASLDKIVGQQRGGFCYELNGAFAALLRELGYDVELVQARVYGDDGEPGIEFDHLCLLVRLDRRYLVDVGFGDSFVEPIPFVVGVDHDDPAGSFRIDGRDDGWYDLVGDGQARYRFEDRPRTITEFTDACEMQQAPGSHFAEGLIATRITPSGRVTLSRRTLIEHVDGVRTETAVDEADLAAVLRDRFGIVSNGG